MFLMNTLTDAQLHRFDRYRGAARAGVARSGIAGPECWTTTSATRSSTLTEHGFIVPSRAADTEALNKFFTDYREDTEQMRVTVLTTLQCNFACDYCFQGDHGDYNKHADRMSLEDSARLAAWIERRLDELKPKTPDADVLRRRAAAQHAGRVRPGGAGVCGLPEARRRRWRSESSPTACC